MLWICWRVSRVLSLQIFVTTRTENSKGSVSLLCRVRLWIFTFSKMSLLQQTMKQMYCRVRLWSFTFSNNSLTTQEQLQCNDFNQDLPIGVRTRKDITKTWHFDLIFYIFCIQKVLIWPSWPLVWINSFVSSL